MKIINGLDLLQLFASLYWKYAVYRLTTTCTRLPNVMNSLTAAPMIIFISDISDVSEPKQQTACFNNSTYKID